MRLLLDTHVLLWWLTAPEGLDEAARKAIEDPANVAFVSVASLWEMAIKASIGRLRLPAEIMELVTRNGIKVLPVEAAHAWGVAALPAIHKDPFDRMLVAQAIHEGMTLITRDVAILAYPVASLPA